MPRKHILWQFLSICVLGQVALFVLGYFFPGVPGLNGVALVVPFIAATFTASQFLKKAQRLPTEEERAGAVKTQFLAWLALSLGFAVTGFALIAFLDAAVLEVFANLLFAAIAAAVLAVLFGLQWLMIRHAWGGQMRSMAKKMKVDQQDT